MFPLVPAYPGCPGSKAVKRSLLLLLFTTGIVPDLLKIAKVIPVHKKGEKNLPGNYRRISLLSVFDKILEKLMHK